MFSNIAVTTTNFLSVWRHCMLFSPYQKKIKHLHVFRQQFRIGESKNRQVHLDEANHKKSLRSLSYHFDT